MKREKIAPATPRFRTERDERARSVYAFREARSLAALGLSRRAEELLTRALAWSGGDMGLEGTIRRRRALARAYRCDRRWQEDIEIALDLQTFEGRTAELNDLLRTKAACVFLATGDRVAARELAEASRLGHLEAGQRRGYRRSTLLLRSLRHPTLARLALRLLY
jgi:hypothetical protein